MSYNGKINSDMKLYEYCIFAKKIAPNLKGKYSNKGLALHFYKLVILAIYSLKKNG